MSAPIAKSLHQGLTYLAKIIDWRIKTYFKEDGAADIPVPRPPKDWLAIESPFSAFVQEHELNLPEQLTLLLAIAPHIQPDFCDRLITAQLPKAGDYPQIGGWRGKAYRGFLPTGETVLFLLGGSGFESRLRLQQLFNDDHLFARKRILYLDPPDEGEPLMSGKLVMSQDYVEWFTQGRFSRPRFSMQFPAERITTEMTWDDLVLNSQTQQQIRELEAWLHHGSTLLYDWGMKKKLKLGYRALFHGPPGTGKTLTASLLGKYTGKDVYKIDISMVISKFIGETEKNLANLFARAENKDWILFFDEADALFGKRTSVRDAHDKYANQEVSYLLQRVENYNGLVILASNFKSNIDEAFIRRFQSIIYFPLPNSKERLALWEHTLPEQLQLDSSISLSSLADTYELTGADILNVVQHCCLQALNSDEAVLRHDDLVSAIKREFSKSGKVV
jgi:AAA+ superfamily predicted ATPase